MKLRTSLLLFVLTVSVYARLTDIDFKIWSDPNYFSVSYNKTRTKEDFIFNVTFNQTIDLILRQTARITISIAESPDSDLYSKILTETSIDFCKIQKIMKHNVVVKAFMSSVLSCMDEKLFKCPYKKGISSLINCKESSFYMPDSGGPDCRFKIEVSSIGKLKTNKWAKLYWTETIGLYVGGSKKQKN
ncbi:unnamed protein product [Diamesa hyperborea]